ncbi:hypothetical protein Hanom_Chr15g01353831 [Helianthus anomalus]
MQGKLGLDTIVGLRIQQKIVVVLGSTRLGSPGDVLISAIQFLFRDIIYSASQLVSFPLPSVHVSIQVDGKLLLAGMIKPLVFVPISVPFDRGKFSLEFYDRRSGCKGGMIPTSHLWVVHGQPRPPESLSKKSTLGCQVSCRSQS